MVIFEFSYNSVLLSEKIYYSKSKTKILLFIHCSIL
jgi:hypothetical protein